MSYQYNRSSQRRTSFKPRPGNNHGRRRGGFQKKPNTINHSKFINKAVRFPQQEAQQTTARFADFDFHPALAGSIAARGYERPTPIQEQAMQALLDGRDVIGLANTGTGKTAAFIVPIINGLLETKQRNAAVIIAPTRELAHQINDEFRLFSRGMKLFSVVCVGGENIHRQRSELKRGVNIIIGTPGRLKDLMQQGALNLGQTSQLVLDEADQMLDMGFLPDMQFIMGGLPKERQVICFSATMTPQITRLLGDIQRNAVTISTVAAVSSEHIDQDIIRAQSKEEKIAHIIKLLNDEAYKKVLVFGETKFGVQRLADELARNGHNTQAIHGNKSQSQRQRALRTFKEHDHAVLVATDVAARGLDIPNVHLVINYDLPQTHETYIHRIGRTGRAGKSGVARTFV